MVTIAEARRPPSQRGPAARGHARLSAMPLRNLAPSPPLRWISLHPRRG